MRFTIAVSGIVLLVAVFAWLASESTIATYDLGYRAGYAAATEAQAVYRVDDPESRHVISTMDRAVAEEIERQEEINAERDTNRP